MSASYRIDSSQRMIFSSATGVLTDDDLLTHQDRVTNDPGFDPTFSQLWDFRHVSDVEVTNATLQELAGARSFRAGAKRAVVAPKDVLYGMARMFQMLHGEAPEDLRVFRSIDEARNWLRLP